MDAPEDCRDPDRFKLTQDTPFNIEEFKVEILEGKLVYSIKCKEGTKATVLGFK